MVLTQIVRELEAQRKKVPGRSRGRNSPRIAPRDVGNGSRRRRRRDGRSGERGTDKPEGDHNFATRRPLPPLSRGLAARTQRGIAHFDSLQIPVPWSQGVSLPVAATRGSVVPKESARFPRIPLSTSLLITRTQAFVVPDNFTS